MQNVGIKPTNAEMAKLGILNKHEKVNAWLRTQSLR